MENESTRAYERWRESAEKFDYFMAGLSVALVGYLAPTLEATTVGFNPALVELVALLALVAATYAAFNRLESSVHVQRVGIAKLEKEESASRFAAAERDGITVIASETGEAMSAERMKGLRENRKALAEVAKELEKEIATKVAHCIASGTF